MWLTSVFGKPGPGQQSDRPGRAPRLGARFRPRLEALEGRFAPATLIVNTAADEYDAGNGQPGPDGTLSLREAIQYAGYGDTIDFAANLAGQTIHMNPNVGLYIERFAQNLTIKDTPGGVKIDGGGNPMSFYFFDGPVSGSSATINDLTFQNFASFDGRGGAIAVFGPNSLTLNRCTVTGNRADNGYGGAVAQWFGGGTLTLNGCTLTGNSAYYGGAIAALNGTLTLKNCNVSGNSAAVGGGVYIDPTEVTIDSCTITGNSAPEGADIYNLQSSLKVYNSSVGDVANLGTVTVIASTVGSITNSSGGTVVDPTADINNLIAQVASLNLTADQKAGLTSKLQAAQQSLVSANTTAAANQLEAFINQVNALVKSHRLGEITADSLITDVQDLIDTIQ